MHVDLQLNRSYLEVGKAEMRVGFLEVGTITDSHIMEFHDTLACLGDMLSVLSGSSIRYRDRWGDVLSVSRVGVTIAISIYTGQQYHKGVEISGRVPIDIYRRFLRNSMLMCMGLTPQYTIASNRPDVSPIRTKI